MERAFRPVRTSPETERRQRTEWDEQMCVDAIAKLLSPRTVFEFGTYNARTTAMFVLKADATVLMLGLAEGDVPQNLFQSDRELAARLRTGYILRDLGLDGRYRQLLVDFPAIRSQASRWNRGARICGRWPFARPRLQRHREDGRHGRTARPGLLARLWRLRGPRNVAGYLEDLQNYPDLRDPWHQPGVGRNARLSQDLSFHTR
jgi:hypothetical protein